jgi:membrane protein DedA with SNARE-associated domain
MPRVSHLHCRLLNILGAGEWACAFTAGGYFFGKLFSAIMHTAQHLLLYILAGAGLLAALIWRFRQRGRTRDGAENGTPPPSGVE